MNVYGPRFSSTPLIEAVRREHDDCVNELLQAGADVNQSDEDHITPLMAAFGDVPRMETLIEAGAEVNPRIGGLKRNPLLEAVEADDYQSVMCLVEAGAKLPTVDECQFYCFLTLETASILTPITYDDYDMFKALIRADADVNCSDRVGFTMLMTIVCDNDDGTEVISESRLPRLKLALKTGAHVNKVNL